MGGIGSGSHWRFGSRGTCEGSKRIDLRYMRKAGLLYTGAQGTLSWTCGGESSGWIRYKVHFHALEVDYKTRPVGGDWTPVNEFIAFEEMEQPYGGKRQFLSCPRCKQRTLVLYGGAYFRCRKCQNLAYRSQNEGSSMRATSKASQIRQRLGCDGGFEDPFPPKPKGMHWSTYRRLERECESHENQIAAEMVQLLARFGGSF